MPTLVLPDPLDAAGFNPNAKIPFGVEVGHVASAMSDFIEFLTVIDRQLHAKAMPSLENTMMQANFSSLVGEFIAARIPHHCPTVARNTYHNGHPDILPIGKYPGNAAQHAGIDGIEIKASRYVKGWQGHNAEDVWLMVFVFQSGRNGPKASGVPAFRFLLVAGAQLAKEDWQFSGRSLTSRRTITASVRRTGTDRMIENWIYRCRELGEGQA